MSNVIPDKYNVFIVIRNILYIKYFTGMVKTAGRII